MKKRTIQRNWQYRVHKTQDRDKQTKNTTQRYCQHWVHQTVPNVDSIYVLCFLFVCLCPVSGVPNVDSISVLCFCLFVFILCLVYPMLTVSQTKNTTQRYCQHWVHQTEDKDKQTKNTTHRYCQHWVHQKQDRDKQTVSLYCVFVCLSLFCVWCTQCWQYLCVVFFVCLSFSCVWCTQCWQYLCVVFK
jgi:hypothetical protein